MKTVIHEIGVAQHWRKLYVGDPAIGEPALIELLPASLAQPIRLTRFPDGEPTRSLGMFDAVRSAVIVALRGDHDNRKAWSHARLTRKSITGPAFRYYGGKYRLGEWIIEQLPKHDHYVEPFGGAASVLLRKAPSKVETLNDLNDHIVNYFQVLRDRPEELVNQILLTPWSRREYENAFAPVDDPVERARRFWVRMAEGIAPAPQAKGWRCVKRDPGKMSEFANRLKCMQNLYAVAERLRSVQIECLPALDVVQKYDDPETLFYVDPPYVAETRSQTQRYAIEWSDDDHRQLAELLRKVEGMVVLSGYRCDLYDELYAGWTRREKRAGGNSGSSRIECL